MIKVLFICHGNICRSPMAEFVFRQMAGQEGLANQFDVSSAATTDEEIYTRDFQRTWNDVQEGCRGLLDVLRGDEDGH